jgi:hypothetical protein
MKKTRTTVGRASGIAVALAVAFPAVALAAPRYAAPTSMGSADCSSPANACELAPAISGASSGDEVIVAGNEGTYGTMGTPLGTLAVNSSSTSVNIHGAAGQPRPVIFTSGGLETYCNSYPCGPVSDLDIEVTGFPFFAGLSAFGGVDHVLVHEHANGQACSVRPAGQTISNTLCVADGSGPALAMNVTYGGGFVGLGFALRNDTFYASQAGGGNGAELFVENGGVGTGALTITATNTIIRSSATDIQTHTAATGGGTQTLTVTFDHSNYATVNTSLGGAVTPANTATNQSAAPVFVNATGDDLREVIGSPTIDAGATEAANGATDLDGSPRTIGPATDVGAYEAAEPATLQSGGVSHVTASSAQLTVSANPNFSTTSVTANVGTAIASEQPTPAASAGAGLTPVTLTFNVSGLKSATTYHFHFAASNSAGPATTADQTFTTARAPGTPQSKLAAGRPRLPKRAKVKRSKALVKLSCPGQTLGCTGTLLLLERLKGRLRVIGSASFSLAAGQTKTIKLKLSREALVRLARARRHRLHVTAKLTHGGSSHSITLIATR